MLSQSARDPYNNCAPVYPWNFVRANTVFGVIHGVGGYTAWSDKHPAYSSVNGPGDGTNLDDFYGPEINSNVVPLRGVTTALGTDCSAVQDPNSDLTAWTNSFQNIQCYDQLKANAILNEIDGFSHNRSHRAHVPTIFGMNFQAVSVGQKLIEKNVGSGGYLDATGTPRAFLLNEIQYVDKAIGNWVLELKKQGLYDSTLIIITAKHGQSPIDSPRYTGITATGPVTTSPSQLIDGCLPASESNAGGQIGPTEDDISLLGWALSLGMAESMLMDGFEDHLFVSSGMVSTYSRTPGRMVSRAMSASQSTRCRSVSAPQSSARPHSAARSSAGSNTSWVPMH